MNTLTSVCKVPVFGLLIGTLFYSASAYSDAIIVPDRQRLADCPNGYESTRSGCLKPGRQIGAPFHYTTGSQGKPCQKGETQKGNKCFSPCLPGQITIERHDERFCRTEAKKLPVSEMFCRDGETKRGAYCTSPHPEVARKQQAREQEKAREQERAREQEKVREQERARELARARQDGIREERARPEALHDPVHPGRHRRSVRDRLIEANEIYNSGANDYRAFVLYKAMAHEGIGDAQYFLAEMYESGIGTQKDLDQAHYWYDRVHALFGTNQISHQVEVYALVAFARHSYFGMFSETNYSRAYDWTQRAYDIVNRHRESDFSPNALNELDILDQRIRHERRN